MSDGTCLTAFKAAYIEKLRQYIPGVLYGSPSSFKDLNSEDGSGVMVGWDDDMTGTLDIVVMAGGGSVLIDETWHGTLVVQATGKTTDDTQEVVDARASEALRYAIGILAVDPSGGVTGTSEIQLFSAVPVGEIANPTGIVGSNARMSRFNVPIEITGRLNITL